MLKDQRKSWEKPQDTGTSALKTSAVHSGEKQSGRGERLKFKKADLKKKYINTLIVAPEKNSVFQNSGRWRRSGQPCSACGQEEPQAPAG